MKKTYLFTLLLTALAIVACGGDSPTPTPALKAKTVKNFEAPGDEVKYDPTTRKRTVIKERDFQYFNFSKGKKVTKNDAWDIGIKGTTIITNGGTSGKGGVKATTVAAIFDKMNSVPEGITLGEDTKTAYAINKNRNFKNRWYSYARGIISPVPGRVIILKDTEGHYVKIEIQCYYKDCPTSPKPGVNNAIYTFRYVHQPNGTKKFGASN